MNKEKSEAITTVTMDGSASPADQMDSAVIGGDENTQGNPDAVRRKNAIHRDKRTRLGRGNPSEVVTD
jgi:hypothetical protein